MTTLTEVETLTVKRRVLPEPEVFSDLTKAVLPASAHGMQTNIVSVKAFQLLLEENPRAEQLIAEAVTEAVNLNLNPDSQRGFKTREDTFYQELFRGYPAVDGFLKDREVELQKTYNTFLLGYLFHNKTFMQSETPPAAPLNLIRVATVPAAYLDTYRLSSHLMEGNRSQELDHKKVQEFVQAFHLAMRGKSNTLFEGRVVSFPDCSAQLQSYWMDDESYCTNLRIAYESLKSAQHFRVLLSMGIWGAEGIKEYQDIPLEWMEKMMEKQNG